MATMIIRLPKSVSTHGWTAQPTSNATTPGSPNLWTLRGRRRNADTALFVLAA